MSTTASTYMSLPVPVVGVEAGPQYATDINACFTLVDMHNHSSGSGVQITPSGININADFTQANNNVTNVKSLRFFTQGSVLSGGSDLGCLYRTGVDLYFNDGSGNQVRITQSGGVAGSPGSIASLASPASATYSAGSGTFIWQSAANTSAIMDGGSVIIRNATANSKGLTLAAPAAMGANYTLVLPSLPGTTQAVNVDSSGNMGTITYDAIGSGMTATGANAIAASMTSTGTSSIVATATAANANTLVAKVTRATGTTVGAGGVAVSTSCGNFSTSSGSYVDVTNLTVTITTSGRPVMLMLQNDATGTLSYFRAVDIGAASYGGKFKFIRDSVTSLGETSILNTDSAANSNSTTTYPSGALAQIDIIGAGTYVYKLAATSFSAATSRVDVQNMVLVAYEL